MVFGCKKCRKVFRKDVTQWEEADEYCPGCDNHFYLEAQTKEQEVVIDLQPTR
jgi:acetone carboxylase gamma subunit